MGDGRTDQVVVTALMISRLRALRMGLLALHKSLIDAERARYERVNGRIESAHQALRLLMEDPWFAWLRPMAQLIVQIDERMADRQPLTSAETVAFEAQIERFVRSESTTAFAIAYQHILQLEPSVVVAHGKLRELLAEQP